jgi:hypothetical protein
MEQLRQSSTSYQSSVVLQRDRLQLSRWLSDHHAKQDCPLCNTHLVEPPAKLGELLISLNGLEEAAAANALPPSFDRELERVAAALSKQVERLKGIRIRQGALTNSLRQLATGSTPNCEPHVFLGIWKLNFRGELTVLANAIEHGQIDEFIDGKHIRKQQRVRLAAATMSEREVKKIATEPLRPLNQGLESLGSATNFEHHIETIYKPVVKPLMATTSFDRTRGVLDNYLIPAFGKCCLRDLTALTLQTYFSKLTTSTTNQMLSHESRDEIRSVMYFQVRCGSPCSTIRW